MHLPGPSKDEKCRSVLYRPTGSWRAGRLACGGHPRPPQRSGKAGVEKSGNLRFFLTRLGRRALMAFGRGGVPAPPQASSRELLRIRYGDPFADDNANRRVTPFSPDHRVFVGSTFSDLVHERNALQDCVWPELAGIACTAAFSSK